MDKQEFIALLNGDLEREYAAAIQYIQHAAVLNGVYFTFVNELLSHADDEIGHAKVLSEHINFLGAVPAIDTGAVYKAATPVMMLQLDRIAEDEAVARYTARIVQAQALGMPGTVAVLLDILKDEEGHLNDLRSILSE